MKKSMLIFSIIIAIVIVTGCEKTDNNIKTKTTKENSMTVIQSNNRDESLNQIEVIVDYIRIREEPNPNSKILGKVYLGEIYTIISVEQKSNGNEWYEIKTENGVNGYIAIKYNEEDYIKILFNSNRDSMFNKDLNSSSSSEIKKDANSSSSSDIKSNLNEYISATGITLNVNTLNLKTEMEYTLTAKVRPENASVKYVSWESSNTSVVKVSYGNITAVGVGSATIIASVENGKYTATCIVNVEKSDIFSSSSSSSEITPNLNGYINASGITLNVNTLNLKTEMEYTLTAKVMPENASVKYVSWESSNTSVVKVSYGNITAVGVGSAIITASVENGKYTATCIVNVEKAELTVSATAGKSTVCTSFNGCKTLTIINVTGKGGSGIYSYNYSVYKNSQLIGTYNKEKTYLPYSTGTYKIEYTVTDSDGDIKSGTVINTIS